MTDPTPHLHWQTAIHGYARHINAYVAKGDACGWEGMGNPDQPPDLSALLPQLMEQLRAATAAKDPAAVAALRAQWPPMHEAIQPLLKANSQGIGALAWLPDGGLLVRTGAWYQPGQVLQINDLHARALPGVVMVGGSPDGRRVAVADPDGIHIMADDGVSSMATLPLPRGDEMLPPRLAEQAQGGALIQQLVPFTDGHAVLVVREDGVFLSRREGVLRLLPTVAELREQAAEDDVSAVHLDMAHATVSSDGQWIACGAQDGRHRIFNGRGEHVCEIGPHGEYPHHAAFFADGRHVALNACHFYNGATIAVDTTAFAGIDTGFYEEHPAVRIVEPDGRMYASAPVPGGGLALGDANGYVRAVDAEGNLLWKQHVGSTISAMAASADGRLLAVGSYSGTVHLLDLSCGNQGPEQIGVNARRELRRWMFWTGEAAPLAW